MNIQLEPGTLLLNKYLIESEIGKGGLGVVYKATDQRLRRSVAIKTLLYDRQTFDTRYGVGTYEHYLERFEREATASSYFTANPNIITVHGLELDANDHFYLILEYLGGGSLSQLVKQQGALSLEQTCAIALDICRALAEIHRHPADIVHRDLKPSNILLRSNGQAVVADFGIAQVGHESQRTSTIEQNHPGSPPYMSPEQRNTHDYLTPASDLYSLGLLIYEMLTGKMYAKYRRLPPSKENPRVPRWMDTLVYKLLQTDLEKRYQQAEEVMEAIQDGLAQLRALEEPTTQILTGSAFTSTASNSAAPVAKPVSEPAPAEEATDSEFEQTQPFGTTQPSSAAKSAPARLYISYKKGAEPDDSVAQEVIARLSTEHAIFVDETLENGPRWAEQVESELRQADYLITFLSAQSIHSEMVEAEIATAFHLAREQGGRPRIIPVRLDYRKPLHYPISTYLEEVRSITWRGPDETERLVELLGRVIAGNEAGTDPTSTPGKPSQPSSSTGGRTNSLPTPLPNAQLEMPEGTMDPQSAFYVARPSDTIALEVIQRQGVTITIKGPRQMGKSSLLLRVRDAAIKAGKQVALLDFQLFDKSALSQPDTFFRQFCDWLTDELEMDSKVEEYWNMPLGNSQRCTRYMQRYILKELGNPLLLAMDEVETIFEADFRSDFFGMLRSWHNSRQTHATWKLLDLALVTSTEPYQLIENLNQSPFNVGEVIELADFTPEQIADLNRRHGSPLNGEDERRLTALLGGHPYLIRRAFYLVASHRYNVEQLFAEATDDQGPFGDHLRNQFFRLHDKPDLVQGLRQVFQSNSCPDERVFFRLRGAGLVKREGRAVVPRCKLYSLYFQEHL